MKDSPKKPAADDDAPPWGTANASRDAITYFEENQTSATRNLKSKATALAAKPDRVLEHGFDEVKEMKFIKIYFNEDLAD